MCGAKMGAALAGGQNPASLVVRGRVPRGNGSGASNEVICGCCYETQVCVVMVQCEWRQGLEQTMRQSGWATRVRRRGGASAAEARPVAAALPAERSWRRLPNEAGEGCVEGITPRGPSCLKGLHGGCLHVVQAPRLCVRPLLLEPLHLLRGRRAGEAGARRQGLCSKKQPPRRAGSRQAHAHTQACSPAPCSPLPAHLGVQEGHEALVRWVLGVCGLAHADVVVVRQHHKLAIAGVAGGGREAACGRAGGLPAAGSRARGSLRMALAPGHAVLAAHGKQHERKKRCNTKTHTQTENPQRRLPWVCGFVGHHVGGDVAQLRGQPLAEAQHRQAPRLAHRAHRGVELLRAGRGGPGRGGVEGARREGRRARGMAQEAGREGCMP